MTGLGQYLDERILLPYLAREVPAIGTVSDIRRITSGSSNEIFELSTDTEPVILRRPPRQRLSASAHDVTREFRVLSALKGTPVPHPEPIHLCTDERVIGTPFVLMAKVSGFHLKAPYPEHASRDGAMRAMMFDFIEVIAHLSQVDWESAGLTGFGRPTGYLDRQVDRWLGQLATYRTRDLPKLTEVANWLRANQPESGPPGIIHGDYQFLNVLFADDLPPRVSGVLDWEQSTVGDPLIDLGWVLGLWTEAGEESPLNAFYGNASQRPGAPTRAELAERYAAVSGRHVEFRRYYETLALFKLGCIAEGSHYRYVKGVSDTALHADFEWIVPKLMLTAFSITQGERD
ncbi:phosphotransferase family protein [Dactylosporangium sp. AC04546]|uniref:phosphotransferase family protein n=1 Tax=Dactylosporangium sp. AC04546 TaxID=2862460 RepID=UPI001EDDFED1|nr:phosphotransferase family protein [Dactylosporangium sp. AC04546]WVK86933.1 phosphotransferase family protein [Dactylosporangium sp. AC04546]